VIVRMLGFLAITITVTVTVLAAFVYLVFPWLLPASPTLGGVVVACVCGGLSGCIGIAAAAWVMR
jgi:hypothetical protein